MTRRGAGTSMAATLVVAMLSAACSPAGGSGGTGGPSTSAMGPGSGAPSIAGPSPSATSVELTVDAAASLKDAMAAIATAYATAAPGTTLTVSSDSSATLRTQIEQGAPADAFLSADAKNPQVLVDAGLTDGGITSFASNRLTIVVPPDNPASISTPADLARPGVKIVAAGDEVPITKYATQVVKNLGGLPGYPHDYAAAYAANVVSREDNVRSVVAKIELGEGDAGIVYVTDAAASKAIKTIDLPPAANVVAMYVGVVVRSSAHPREAKAFLDWLVGSGGQAILASIGFRPPSS
jgi:molybdate transport system substrate-binding protein